MKKVMILLVGLMITSMYAGGYYPSYGPGEQWSPSVSTSQAFILFDDITLNGAAVDAGAEGGGTGTCDTEDCDIIGVMYDGQNVGWSYLPKVNNVITVVAEFKDANTEAAAGYPNYVPGTYDPVVTFNFYDASAGQMYYNIGSAQPAAGGMTSAGSLDITGSGTACSTDGFAFGASEFCLAGAGCDQTSGGSAGAWDTFDAIGNATGSCAYNGCGDATAVNAHAGASAGDAINDDGSCLYSGCSDVNATNTYNDGFDCAGDAGEADQSCCTFAPDALAISFSYYGYEVTADWAGSDSYTCSVDGGNAVACASGFGFDGDFNTDATLTVTTDNGAVDAGGAGLTYGNDAVANPGAMPTPSVTSVDVTASADGCVDVAFTEDFGYNGVTVSLDGQSATWASSPTTFCGLQAGASYEASVTSGNQAGSDTATGSGSTTAYAAGQLVISAIEVSTYSILVTFSGAENYGGDANWMYTACADDICNSSPNPSISISGLAPTTDYAITTSASSQYGALAGDGGAGTTADPPAGEVWKFDITAEMTVLGQQYINDMNNRIGFYYESSQAASDAGITEPLPPASDGFDAYWDVPEMSVANPDNEIHFYIENNWDEQTGWGRNWAYDIRALNDDSYATNNQTTFNGVVVAETGGLATVTITPGGVTDGLVTAANTYVPVYALVNGGGHNGDYYKLERDAVTIPLTLQSNTPVSIDFIVGNLIPEQADGLSSSSDASALASGSDWKPGSDLSFDTDDSCDDVSLEGVDFTDPNGSNSYDLTRCNSFEQRYPATSYTVASSSERGESGMATGSHNASADGSLADSEDDLEFATGYTYTVTAHNGAGEGASTSTSLTTVANVDPAFTDLCTNDGNNNDCASVISSAASGEGSGPETDEGLVTDGSDDIYLYHTYTTAHDGIGRLSAGGTDADGLDQSGTEMTINLASAYTDHEGYTLDASWSGDIDVSNVGANSSTTQCEGAEVINSLPYTANGTYDSNAGPWQTFNSGGSGQIWENGQSGYALEYSTETSITLDISSCGTEGDPIMTIYRMTNGCEMEYIYDNDDDGYDLEGNECSLNGCATGAFGLQLDPGTYYIVISSLWNDIDYGYDQNATDPFSGCCDCLEDEAGNCLEDGENGYEYSSCGGDTNSNANVVLNIAESTNTVPRSDNHINSRTVSAKLNRPIHESTFDGSFIVEETPELRTEGPGEFVDGNSSSVTFTVTEPNSGSGSSYNFDLAVTDNNWLTNGGNGSNTINTNITVTILPEPNQAPEADVSVPAGQADEAGGGYWQVPHNADNEYTCDDLLAYGDQSCDDNRASITLSHDGSFDADCGDGDPLCEENDFWWSEAVMGMSYNDLNMNGEYDAGEPCNDGCLWDFDENGISPAVNDGPESHANDHQQRHDGGTGNIWTLTVQDNYGAENTAARGFFVLPEPNTRAYSSSATDANSSHKYDGDNGGDDDDVHYLPEGADVTTVTVNTGGVTDADGDNITYTTTLNGDAIAESSGDCGGSCATGEFSRDLGPGEYTVTTCAQDSYEGYEYLMYASTANGATDAVDATVETTQNAPECTSFSFVVIAEPSAVDVTSLATTDQGMSYISMSWDASDHSINGNVAQLDELGENATHYVVERTTNPTNTASWSTITTLNVVREYNKRDCSGKEDIYDNFSDACEDPTTAQASDDGEWYFMGRDGGSFHFLDEGLAPNTTYNYRVFAINSHGRSSGTGNVLSHSTEAKPEMSFSRDMSAEIYAVGDMTNTMTASFSASDDLGGHNISSVTSSYTTYEGTNSNTNGYHDGPAGEDVAGPDDVTFSYAISAWETDHGQSIEVCFEDAGDFWGYDKDGACASTASFTGSEEFLHHPYTYNGWHVFGAPMYSAISMDNLMAAGLEDYSAGSDFVWFTQSGAFGEAHMYNFGQAYFLGLNHELVSFTMQGNILSSQDDSDLENDLSLSGHSLERGWNLVSPKLVRPVDVDMLTVTDDLGTHTWAEAQTLGLVSGEVLGTDDQANFESDSFSPWAGYWIHASKTCELGVAPHAFDLAKEEVELDYMVWNMNIEASPVNGDARGDIIKLGLSDVASNDIVNGEDTEDIPVMTMADSYLDLYMKDANGMRLWKNTKAMISPDQGQAWTINGYSANSLSDVQLEWTMDEIDAAYDITMFINGEAIDMRAETSIVVSTEALNSITVVVGNDPLASGLGTPAKFALNDAYPNPFNPVTSMQLSLDADGFTSVKVYNLMGQVVEVLHEGMLQAGYHQVSWTADVVPSGVYLVKVEQGDKIATQKVMLMK